jgi:hypothetical protein
LAGLDHLAVIILEGFSMRYSPSRPAMRIGLLAMLCCIGIASANAKTTKYTFTGNWGVIYEGTCLTTTQTVTQSLTVSEPLPANFTGDITPLSWSANDGVRKFNSSQHGAGAQPFYFVVQGGVIVQWSVNLYRNGANGQAVVGIYNDSETAGTGFDNICSPHAGAADLTGAWSAN